MSDRTCLWCKKPLPFRRRQYCSDECGDEYRYHYIIPLWWDVAKTMAIERAGHKCEGCGKVGYLEVHHIEKLADGESYHNNPKNRQENLRVLCRPCHEKTHHSDSGIKQREEISKLQGVLL